MTGLGAPSLPIYITIAVTILTAALIMFVMARVRNAPISFVLGAAWLRFIMSAFHDFTYKPLFAGMSTNALGSIFTFGVGLLTINWRHLALQLLLPIYAMAAIAIMSSLANGAHTAPGLITVLTKYGYLIVVILSVYEGMRRARGAHFMTSFLWAFVPPFVFQVFSVILHVVKNTEADPNAVSYIGGYYHEAAFSVVLATALTAACFAGRLNKYFRNGLIAICVVGILLANYRTVLVACVPLLAAYFGFSTLRQFPKRDRPFVVSAIIVVGCLVFGVISMALADRFSDIGVAASGHVNFFKPPEQYSVDESRLLSGRAQIWSTYIYGWIRGTTINHLFGFGPESWDGVFPLYAHNTLVSSLYEYGPWGVIGDLWLWLSMLSAALRVRHPQRGMLIGAHVSFIVLNMSTMPMWMIEGNLLYGMICGYTFYLLSLQGRQPAQARRPAARTQQASALAERPNA